LGCQASRKGLPNESEEVLAKDRIQDDHRDLALGLALIIGIERPEFQCLRPEPRPFGGRGRPRPRRHLLGSDLNLDDRVNEDVAVPSGMLRGPAFGRDHEITVADLAIEQRKDELLS